MNPILSIFLAFLITIVLAAFYGHLGSNLVDYNLGRYGFLFFIIVVFLCGGFATWFSTDKKVRYSFYYGLIIDAVIFIFMFNLLNGSLSLIYFLIFSVFGGYVAKNEKDNIKNFFNKKNKKNSS